jgi:hypothetical protein
MPATFRSWTYAALITMLAALAGCEPLAPEEQGTVQLTVRLQLRGDRNVGPTAGKVYVFDDSLLLGRASAYPANGQECALDTTPVTVCTFTVPRRARVSLVAVEPDPAVFVRFAPKAATDTVRDGYYVEFTGWTACVDRPDRGMCVIRPSADVAIEANFQLMQQVTVYQTGAAHMDYVTFAAAFTLKAPAQNDNILDLAGCRRVYANRASPPCDPLRLLGDQPFHRFTAFVPQQTIVGMFPVDGLETTFVRWDGDCILSGVFGGGVCSLISPPVSGPPIILTLRYQWWDCAGGPSDRNTGACVLKEP